MRSNMAMRVGRGYRGCIPRSISYQNYTNY